MSGRIVVVGSSNTDMVIKMNHLPQPGETVIGHSFFTAAGGKGANQAVAAARCGGDVRFIACVGDDDLGKSAIHGFQKDAIDTSSIKISDSHPSGIAQIWVDAQGENSIAVAPGANMALSIIDLKSYWHHIEEAEIVLVQLEIPIETVEYLMEHLSKAGKRLILNPAPATNFDLTKLDQLFLITPNESEAAQLAGYSPADQIDVIACGDALIKRGCQHVIITQGAQGCTWFHGARREFFSAFDVTALDTTAAGDVFNGALAVCLSKGHAFPDAIHFASAAAAISVTKNGAQDSAPPLEEIELFIAKNHS